MPAQQQEAWSTGAFSGSPPLASPAQVAESGSPIGQVAAPWSPLPPLRRAATPRLGPVGSQAASPSLASTAPASLGAALAATAAALPAAGFGAPSPRAAAAAAPSRRSKDPPVRREAKSGAEEETPSQGAPSDVASFDDMRLCKSAGTPPPRRSRPTGTANTDTVLQRLKSSLFDRIKRLEVRRRVRERQQKTLRRQDSRRRAFNLLPKSEVDALERAFLQFDGDRSGHLERREIVDCLRELGLRGSNTAEKRDILKICMEATAPAPPEPGEGRTPRVRILSEGRDTQEEGSAESAEGEGDDVEGGAAPEEGASVRVDFLTFALDVVPRVRQRLAEVHGDALLRQFYEYDKSGSGRLELGQCMQIASRLGIDRQLVRRIFVELHGRVDGDVDFDEFRVLIEQARERADRLIREHERNIKTNTGISTALFRQFRPDIVNLWELFCRYDVDGSGALGLKEAQQVLRQFGILPRRPKELEYISRIVARADKDQDGELQFPEFLNLTGQVRQWVLAQKQEEELACFQRYDRDGSGTLSVEELSLLLCDLGINPKTRKEQEELASLLRCVDADGSGLVDFKEFQVLSQRIEERLRSMRYQEEVEYALKCGFSEAQLFDLRWVFDALDSDGSEHLDAAEIRSGLAMMRKQVSQDAFESAFRALDQDGSGELDFLEFLDFMRLLHDGEGIFSEAQEPFARRVRFLEGRVLRRALELGGLSKAYVSALPAEDLVALFCTVFEVGPNDNLQEKLRVSSVGELLAHAKVRGEAPG